MFSKTNKGECTFMYCHKTLIHYLIHYLLKQLCSYFTDINECESNPCQFNGICTDHPDKYTCVCQAGRHGISCEFGIVSSLS